MEQLADTSMVALLQREIFRLSDIPRPEWAQTIRHFGVALDNDEAQEMLAKDWRVFGDERGPYLVIRLKAEQNYPWGLDAGTPVDIMFRPVPWKLRDDRQGIICWFEKEVFAL